LEQLVFWYPCRKPENPNLYYIFTTEATGGTEIKYARYSVLDMNLNAGNGDIVSTEKNISFQSYAPEALEVILHANGKDYWIISFSTETNEFKCYLLNEDGLQTPPVTSNGTGFYFTFRSNNKGNMLYMNTYSNPLHAYRLLNFDNATGLISFNQSFEYSSDVSAVTKTAFSPDDSKLYTMIFAVDVKTHILQFDLSQTPLKFDTIATSNSPELFFEMKTAPNHKIYVYKVNTGNNFISVINNPNLKHPNCNFVENIMDLSPGRCSACFPNTIKQTPCQSLAGTYTINNTQATADRNFNTFTDAVEALKCGGISDAVTFDVANGTYNEQITIPFIEGSSATDTITFCSASADYNKVILQSAENKQSAVLLLDSTAYLRFYNLSIKNIRTQEWNTNDTLKHTIKFLQSNKNIKFSNSYFLGANVLQDLYLLIMFRIVKFMKIKLVQQNLI